MIDRIELNILKMPLVEHFETSFGRIYEREVIVIMLYSDGLIAYSEATSDKDPLYSYEDNKTVLHILKDYLFPIIIEEKIEEPEIFQSKASKIKGHNMAKSAVELALWDLKAKKLNMPLWKLWGGEKDKIEAGVSIGIKDNLSELFGIIEKRVAEGYKRIKLKIKPGKDVDVISAVRERFPKIFLSVDCNAAYSIEEEDIFKELDKYNLMMIEQPLSYDDLYFHSKLQEKIKTPICLDESIVNFNRAKEAILLGSCKIINIKLGRVGGYIEGKKIHDYCLGKNIPLWCGGMLETGIGRAFNVAIATLKNFKFPNDISATKRYWREDIIDYEFELKHGMIEVPKGKGIGVELDMERIKKYRIGEWVNR